MEHNWDASFGLESSSLDRQAVRWIRIRRQPGWVPWHYSRAVVVLLGVWV